MSLYTCLLENRILKHYNFLIFGIIFGIFLVTFVTENDLLNRTLLDQKASGQETNSLSNQITQPSDNIEKTDYRNNEK